MKNIVHDELNGIDYDPDAKKCLEDLTPELDKLWNDLCAVIKSLNLSAVTFEHAEIFRTSWLDSRESRR